jgi:hypothetical protein
LKEHPVSNGVQPQKRGGPRVPRETQGAKTASPKAKSAPAAKANRPGFAGATMVPPERFMDSNEIASRWSNFKSDGGKPWTQITNFYSPMMNPAGLMKIPFDHAGETIPMEMTVKVHGDPRQVKAELWTNANNNGDPESFYAIPMGIIRTSGDTVTFRADVPMNNVGNYKATARLSTDGGQTFQWAGKDVRYRPRPEAHDALNIDEISVGNVNSVNGKPGTFADMMDSGSPLTNGKYTLEWIAQQGKTAVWVMPPFERSKWDHRHHMDDAGSPYAVKDFFSASTELSRAARGKTGEEARNAANAEFKAFVEKAHSLGIKVIIDVALNHVGHNYEFRDLFVRYDNAGKEIREVRKNDFSQVAVNPEQLDTIKRRLADPKLPDYMDHVAPHMFANKNGDPRGAQNANDKIAGGWGEWMDVASLNHSKFRYQDRTPSEENKKVEEWLGRVLRYWAVDMNVDGFRLDHMTGLSKNVMENVLNRVQADVDKHQPGKALFLTGEDFMSAQWNSAYVDNIQGGWFHEFNKARTPGDFQRIVESPYFNDLLNLSSHDEERFLEHFGNDYQAATRLGCLIQLLGGPSMDVAGDHFLERNKLPFKSNRDVPAMKFLDDTRRNIAETYGRVGRARKALPELQDDNRAFLQPKLGGPDNDLLALSRFTDEKSDRGISFVFSNLSNTQQRENAFALDNGVKSRLDPNKRYNVKNLLADDPNAWLWPQSMTGRELMDRGIFVKLGPYHTQVLKLVEAN